MGDMYLADDMYPDSLETIRQVAKEAYGQIDEMYLHWTAGHY